jgi:hypothetical protein
MPHITEVKMTFHQAIAELREKYPKAGMSPTAVRGECFDRRIDFRKSKGWLYAGRDDHGELLLYYNETERLICCTEADE